MDRNKTSLTFERRSPQTRRNESGRRRKRILEVAVPAAESLRQKSF
jgi:hypothetical protein